LFLFFVAIAALVQAADPTDAVRAAAAGWRQGAIKQDQSLLNRFLADDLVYVHSGGKNQSKAEYIAEVTKGPSHYESFSESDTNIRFYGKTAVLTGFVDIRIPKGEPYRVRTLEVYLEREGRWQLAQKESVRVSR
jgi:ketosteroid isomerase-like protein